MVASEQVPLSETSRTPQNYQLGNADVKHNKVGFLSMLIYQYKFINDCRNIQLRQ